MTLTDLQNELEKDLPINLTILQSEAAGNPVLYGKWVRYLADLNKEQIRLETTFKVEYKDALLYYTGRGDDVCMDVFTPTELKSIIPAHETVLKASQAIELLEAKASLCRSALEAIKQRGFSIKAAIDIRKLEAGE